MTTNKKEIAYEAPQVEVIAVRVEKGFAISNLENPKEGEESEW